MGNHYSYHAIIQKMFSHNNILYDTPFNILPMYRRHYCCVHVSTYINVSPAARTKKITSLTFFFPLYILYRCLSRYCAVKAHRRKGNNLYNNNIYETMQARQIPRTVTHPRLCTYAFTEDHQAWLKSAPRHWDFIR